MQTSTFQPFCQLVRQLLAILLLFVLQGTKRATTIVPQKISCPGIWIQGVYANFSHYLLHFPHLRRKCRSYDSNCCNIAVHVWQIAGETEVKAQIKLRFRTNTGQPVVIIRSFQVTMLFSPLTAYYSGLYLAKCLPIES